MQGELEKHEEILPHMLYDDRTRTHASQMQELQAIQKLLDAAMRAEKYHDFDTVWNSRVHEPLLDIALRASNERFKIINVYVAPLAFWCPLLTLGTTRTTARLIRDVIPTKMQQPINAKGVNLMVTCAMSEPSIATINDILRQLDPDYATIN